MSINHSTQKPVAKARWIPVEIRKSIARKRFKNATVTPRPTTPIQSSGVEVSFTGTDASGAWDPISQVPASGIYQASEPSTSSQPIPRETGMIAR